MPVAIRAATRIQDMDDANVSLGVGVDEYALVYDHGTASFVLRAMSAGVTDHGALTGLTPDDDHTQYALLAGRAGGTTLYGGTAANEDITIHGTSDATRTTSYVILQPTGGNVGVGTTSPANGTLHVVGNTAGAVRIDGLDTNASTTAGTAARIMFVQLSNDANVRGALEFWNGAISKMYATMGCQYTNRGAGTETGDYYFSCIYNGTSFERMRVSGAGRVGIGTPSPGTLLHGLLTSAATNAITDVLTIGHDTSGTAAAGFGAGQLFALESSTTAAQSAARVQALWYEATHATRKADLVLTAYDTAEREGLRIRGDGSGPAIGFYGVAPIARAILATGAGATADNIITALQNLGLVKQS